MTATGTLLSTSRLWTERTGNSGFSPKPPPNTNLTPSRLGQTRQVTVYRLVCKGTIEERILQRAREKEEIHRMVIQGGSFKGKAGDLKPKEVVSLLLDDEEIEKRVKVKLEEEEEKEKVEKEKKEKSKAKKREGAPIKAESEKKPKLENEVSEEPNDIDADVNSEDSKPLYDFAGDKMGPKKGKGRGAGKRGRPRGALKSIGRGGEGLKKGSNNHEAENGHSLLDEDSLGFFTQT